LINMPVDGFTIYPRDYKKPLTLKDFKAVEGAFAGRGRVNAGTSATGTARFGPATTQCALRATFYPSQDPLEELLSGRLISEEDDHEARLVAIAHPSLLKTLSLDPRSAPGKTVEVNGLPLILIGVRDYIASFKAFRGEQKDNWLDIPSSTLRSRFRRSDTFEYIRVYLAQGQRLDSLVTESVGVLRNSHGLKAGEVNDFRVRSSEETRRFWLESTRSFRVTVWLVAVVSALLALMMGWYLFTLQAQQRMQEWGIQRALGATRGQILHIYLVEISILLAASIALGVLLGTLGTWIVRNLAIADTTYVLDFNRFVSTSFVDALLTFAAWAIVGPVVALIPFRKAIEKPVPELLR